MENCEGKNFRIETDRLILRNYRMSDFADFWACLSNRKIGPMAGGWPPYDDPEKVRERLGRECKKPLHFAIYHKEAKRVVGSVELTDYTLFDAELGAKEMWFMLNEDFWGQRIMPEAVAGVLKLAFEKLNLPEIAIAHVEANTRSCGVQERLGFKVVGRTKNYRPWLDGKNSDLIHRKMTKEEYQHNDKLKAYRSTIKEVTKEK